MRLLDARPAVIAARGMAAPVPATLRAQPQPRWVIDPWDNTVLTLPRGNSSASAGASSAARLAIQCPGDCAAVYGTGGNAAWPIDIVLSGFTPATARSLVLTIEVAAAWAAAVEGAWSLPDGVVMVNAAQNSSAQRAGGAMGPANAQFVQSEVTFDLQEACSSEGGACEATIAVAADALAVPQVPLAQIATASLRLRLLPESAAAGAVATRVASTVQEGLQVDRVQFVFPHAVLPQPRTLAQSLLTLEPAAASGVTGALVLYDPAARAVDVLVARQCRPSDDALTLGISSAAATQPDGSSASTSHDLAASMPCVAPPTLRSGSAARGLMLFAAAMLVFALVLATAALVALWLRRRAALAAGITGSAAAARGSAVGVACGLLSLILLGMLFVSPCMTFDGSVWCFQAAPLLA